MPFKEGADAGWLLSAEMLGEPPTSEQIEAYARQQVELCNIERRNAGLPDFEFIKVEGDSILMRDPMPMRYVRGSHQIL